MKRLLILLIFILSISPLMANAMGSVNEFVFYLDTSVQGYFVTINKPTFPTNPDFDFNKYVQCTNYDNKIPIIISGFQQGYYNCTQTSTLDLKPNESYMPIASILVTANEKQLVISNIDYSYDPWSNKGYQSVYLIYLDPQGQLAYRRV